MPVLSLFHPLNDWYTGSILLCVIWNGISFESLPPTLYDVQTFRSVNASKTSALVITICVQPFNIQAYCKATKSIHPHRRGRPVVAPYSFPTLRSFSPVSSSNSVGKGPPPTRVQ